MLMVRSIAIPPTSADTRTFAVRRINNIIQLWDEFENRSRGERPDVDVVSS